MYMLLGESILLESDGKVLVLTSHRVRYRASTWGAEDVVSILLEEIASCGLLHTSHPVLLILAGLSAFGFVTGAGGRVGWFVLGAILIGAFLATRRQALAIASAGHTIRAQLTGMGTDAAMKFIEEVEAAKDRRRSPVHASSGELPPTARRSAPRSGDLKYDATGDDRKIGRGHDRYRNLSIEVPAVRLPPRELRQATPRRFCSLRVTKRA